MNDMASGLGNGIYYMDIGKQASESAETVTQILVDAYCALWCRLTQPMISKKKLVKRMMMITKSKGLTGRRTNTVRPSAFSKYVLSSGESQVSSNARQPPVKKWRSVRSKTKKLEMPQRWTPSLDGIA